VLFRQTSYIATMLTYAIGDIHGRHDLLQELLGKIADHAGEQPYRLVFLGDYIDRGPESAAVIETVRRLQNASPDNVVCLMGNHEAMLLTAIDEPAAILWWIRNGGDTTLASFGVRVPSEVPPDVLNWLNDLPISFEDDRRYFVHAGLRPGSRFEAQTVEDKLWIREPFLSGGYDFGKHVVHGHTPVALGLPDTNAHRTNLDTGAVFGGALTAGIFTDEQGPPSGFLSTADRKSR
jgi:serine/threonine protein phosphatase 1